MPVWVVWRVCERASLPTIVAMTWMRVAVSFALVDWERSRLICARTHGCVEMWTVEGSSAIVGSACLASVVLSSILHEWWPGEEGQIWP